MWEGAKLCSHYALFPLVAPAFLPAARTAVRASGIDAHSVSYAESPQKPKEEVTIGGHLSVPDSICRNAPAGQTSFCAEGTGRLFLQFTGLKAQHFNASLTRKLSGTKSWEHENRPWKMVFVPPPIFPSSLQQAKSIVNVERRGIIMLVIYKLAMGCSLQSQATAIQVSDNPCNKYNRSWSCFAFLLSLQRKLSG